MAEQVIVREVGLRDGLQMVRDFLPTEIKNEWISRQAALGFSDLEVTSFVPPKLLPQFSDAENTIEHANSISNLTGSALVLNAKGATRAMQAGARKICFVLSASEKHNQSNVRCSTKQSLDVFREIMEFQAANHPQVMVAAAIATSFGCSLQGDVPENLVIALAGSLAEAGAKEIVLADTVGYGNPIQVQRIFTLVGRELSHLPLAAHFHDTRGMGLANVNAALETGVRIFDAALGGLGGCPFAPGATGNIATEDTVYMLEAMGFDTGVDLAGLLLLRRDLEGWLHNETLQGRLFAAKPAMNFLPAHSRETAS